MGTEKKVDSGRPMSRADAALADLLAHMCPICGRVLDAGACGSVHRDLAADNERAELLKGCDKLFKIGCALKAQDTDRWLCDEEIEFLGLFAAAVREHLSKVGA